MAIEETALNLIKDKQGFELAFYIVLALLVAVLYLLIPSIKEIKMKLDTLILLIQNSTQATSDIGKVALNAIQNVMEKNK